MIQNLLSKFNGYGTTSSVTDIQNKSVVYIKDMDQSKFLKTVEDDIWIIAHKSLEKTISHYQSLYCPTVKVYYSDYPEYIFTLYHNAVNEKKRRSKPYIGKSSKIHSTVIMDTDGLKMVITPEGKKINFKYMGHIMIGDDVRVGPYTVIYRGTLGITSIKSYCQIGSHCVIGHNSIVSSNSVLEDNVIIKRFSSIGNDCLIEAGAIIGDNITICDGVVIKTGSIITDDINKPGFYDGAVRMR